MTSQAPLLELSATGCAYDEIPVVSNVSFQLNRGQTACLLGPSGCGKTTTLRAIAGFEPLTDGFISLAGSDLSRPGYTLPPERRQPGMVFQDYALFPHLTVQDNIAFGLENRKDKRDIISRMLDLTGLHNLAKRYPHELSGGQQQRVALAPGPELLLLDEPFSNLDAGLRKSLSHEVREILHQENTSAILVTHDQEEVYCFADSIGIMHEGQLQQWGSPQELYCQPANAFVANFIGEGVLIDGISQQNGFATTAIGVIPIEHNPGEDLLLQVLIRPADVELTPNDNLSAHVKQLDFQGDSSLVHLQISSGETLLAQITDHSIQRGDSVTFQVNANPLHAFITG